MERIIAIFHTETTYFSEHITTNVRRVIRSNFWYTISSPLISIFLGAFIWRATGSLLPVLIYKLGGRIMLPISFYLNGLLLRKWHIRTTYIIGSITAGLSSIALVLASPTHLGVLFLFGCLWGLGNGFYFGNRNFLELSEITSPLRQYFSGLMSSITHFSSILVPFLAGWFITIGEKTGWYLPVHAYWILFTISFILLLRCGQVIAQGTFESPIPGKLLRFGTRPFFSKRRLLQFGQGCSDGIMFLVGILVLYFFGDEGVLGTTTSILSVITIFATYLYGRTATPEHRNRNMLLASVAYTICGLALALLPHSSGAIIYILFMGLSSTFYILATNPVVLDLAESEVTEPSDRISLVIDNELFLNIGRVAVMGILIAFFIFGSQELSMFYGPLCAALLQLGIVILASYKKSSIDLK